MLAALRSLAHTDLTRDYATAQRAKDYAAQDVARASYEARRFTWSLGTGNIGGLAASSTGMVGPRELRQQLYSMGLDVCAKRDAKHLLTVVEYRSGAHRCTQLWVGSLPGMKLTDWNKQFGLLPA